MLPHKENQQGKEVLVNGPIGDRFVAALEQQQILHAQSQEKGPELSPAEKWELLARKHQQGRERAERTTTSPAPERTQNQSRASISLDQRHVSASWNPHERAPDLPSAISASRWANDWRWNTVWVLRKPGTTVLCDTGDLQIRGGRSIDWRRTEDLRTRCSSPRRSPRNTVGQGDRIARDTAIDTDLARHTDTLQQLSEARERIATLGKDVSSLAVIWQKLSSA